MLLLEDESATLEEELVILEETLLPLQMSSFLQTSTCLHPVVTMLPSVVVVAPLPNVAFELPLQSTFMTQTFWKQLEDKLDVSGDIEELELKSEEIEEDKVRR